jgi:hypothetical protein
VSNKPKIIGSRTKNVPKKPNIKQQTWTHTHTQITKPCVKNRNPNQHRIETEVTTINIKHPEYIFGFLGVFSSWSNHFWFTGHQTMNKVQKYASTNNGAYLNVVLIVTGTYRHSFWGLHWRGWRNRNASQKPFLVGDCQGWTRLGYPNIALSGAFWQW